MISNREMSELLAKLYAAPLQPEKWQLFFDHLSKLTRISTGCLMTFGPDTSPAILAGGGLAWNPEIQRSYNERYAHVDPFRDPALRNPRVAVIRGQDLVSHNELVKTELYNDLLSKNEMESITLLTFFSTGEEGDFMPMWRRKQDGPMDESSIALLEILLPHAHEALKIRRKVQALELQSDFSSLALEAMATAVLLVSASGQVLHMNSLASAIVNKGEGLRLEGSSLTSRNPSESATLKSTISAAAMAGGPQIQAKPGGALNISRPGAKSPLQVAILPLPESVRRGIKIPCALVFVSDPNAAPPSRSASLRALYALTPTEARLADLLLQGLEVHQIADRMKTTLETARFNLKRVLAKTETRRQSELIRLMLSLPGQ